MNTREFLNILNILEKNIPDDAPSNILKNSFKRTPYTILIATLLSLRTKDENTARVCKKLFQIANTPQSMLEIPVDELEQIVKSTGMYHKKAGVVREVSEILIDRFNSRVTCPIVIRFKNSYNPKKINRMCNGDIWNKNMWKC
jgi:endonuclease-3